MCDLICDVTSCCALSCDTGKINVHETIVLQIREKRKYRNKRNVYINIRVSLGI